MKFVLLFGQFRHFEEGKTVVSRSGTNEGIVYLVVDNTIEMVREEEREGRKRDWWDRVIAVAIVSSRPPQGSVPSNKQQRMPARRMERKWCSTVFKGTVAMRF